MLCQVGYCQGTAFIVGLLLMQMPEEESFAVLVKIMKDYGMREMFKPSMTELGLCMYQLDTLIEQHMPDLHVHFQVKIFEILKLSDFNNLFFLLSVAGNPHQPVRQPLVSHIIYFLCLGVSIKQVSREWWAVSGERVKITNQHLPASIFCLLEY